MSLSEEQRQQLDSVLVAFDRHWTADLLAAKVSELATLDAPMREAAFAEMVKIDIERQWQKGRNVEIEEYLRQFPELGTSETVRADVIEAEYQARRHYGAGADLDEFIRRFPNQAESFRRLIDAQDETFAGREDSMRDAPTVVSEESRATITQVGRYVIEKEIGRGGMGIVFRARDPAFNRSLAVKVLPADPTANPDLAVRFREEAQVMGRLQHPGIPPVHDRGELPDGRLFFTMKQIEGNTLAELLKAQQSGELRENISGARLVHIFEQVCQTVAYAHSQGIIHRDLKPANIMVGAFGEVQVMDWGLAKDLAGRSDEIARSNAAAGAPNQQIDEETSESLTLPYQNTQPGTVIGTPGYMPPEQARGEIDSLDERCDVFSLGAVLCDILTGERPFSGRNLNEIHMQAVREELGGAFERLDECSAAPELVKLSKRCLAAHPKDRFRNAAEVADAVAQHQLNVQEKLRRAELEKEKALVQAEEERKRQRLLQAKAMEERKRRRMAWALLASIAALGACIGGLFLWNSIRVQRLNDNVAAKLDSFEIERQALHRRLADPIAVRQLLNNFEIWQAEVRKLKAIWRQAKDLVDTDSDWISAENRNRLKILNEKLASDQRDRRFAARLESIRLESSQLFHGKQDLSRAAKNYSDAFADRGLDVGRQAPHTVAELVRVSPIRHALVAALDHWAESAQFAKIKNVEDFTSRLLEVARRADPDPWRDAFRKIESWNSLDELKALAKKVDMKRQSPQIITAFAFRLFVNQGDAAGFLRKAVLHHRDDFWMYYHLAKAATNRDEQISWYRAALALRPRSAIALTNLGLMLRKQGDYSRAIELYKLAIDSDQTNYFAHYNYGNALVDLDDLEGAIGQYCKAIAINPKVAQIHNNLGGALQDKGDKGKAVFHFREALRINPKLMQAHINLGELLRDQGKFVEALAILKKGVSLLPPGYQQAALTKLLIEDCQRLLDLKAQLPSVLSKKTKAEAQEKLECARLCLRYLKRYREAVQLFEEALAELPKSADDPLKFLRYDAARAAVLAAGGADDSKLRTKALNWLHLDLQNWQARVRKDPISVVRLHEHLQALQVKPDFASVRDIDSRAKLPEAEKHAWLAFWSNLSGLQKQARDGFTETRSKGVLTAQRVTQSRLLSMKTGTIIIIEMRSKKFDTFLRLHDDNGRKIAENDDIDYYGSNLNSRIIFTAPKDGNYRVVATSYGHRGRGVFEIIIRKINAKGK